LRAPGDRSTIAEVDEGKRAAKREQRLRDGPGGTGARIRSRETVKGA
jgi:hypothetical protein